MVVSVSIASTYFTIAAYDRRVYVIEIKLKQKQKVKCITTNSTTRSWSREEKISNSSGYESNSPIVRELKLTCLLCFLISLYSASKMYTLLSMSADINEANNDQSTFGEFHIQTLGQIVI